MVRKQVTLSLDLEVRDQAKFILKSKGIALSHYVEQCLRNLISEIKQQIIEKEVIEQYGNQS